MSALFRPRITVHQPDFGLLAHVWPVPLAFAPERHQAALLAATIRVGRLAETRAVVHQAAWTALPVTSRPHAERLAVMGRSLRLPPLGVSDQRLDGVTLTGRVRELNLAPPVRVHRDLAAVRARPVERRGVPARLLSPEQVVYWRKRLGESKRVTPNLVELVAIFPDVPIVGDQPVQYANGALSYVLPETRVPLSTVVIAKHTGSGALLLGRFARG